MNRIFLVGLLMLVSSFGSRAQFFTIPNWDYNWDLKAHEKGQIHFTYGYGLPRMDKKLFDYHKSEIDFRVVGVGPFFLRVEHGLSRKLSVALSASYILYKSDWKSLRPDPLYTFDLPFTYGNTLHDISANLRFNYHLFVNKEWDVYIGGGAGYNHFMSKDFTTYLPEDSTFNSQFKIPYPVSYEMSLGVRYFFLTRTAIYLEAGLGKALVQGGFVFKFRHRKRG
ncbi:MAG TPA: hypothetical protein DCF44_06135 [Chitinophagaceae bacterium]|nr:hypothetical protein [Chitinophagaceae bacterium]